MVSTSLSLHMARLLASCLLALAGLSAFARDLEIITFAKSGLQLHFEAEANFRAEASQNLWLESAPSVSGTPSSWEPEPNATFHQASERTWVISLVNQQPTQRFYRVGHTRPPITFDIETLPPSVLELHDKPIVVELTEPVTAKHVELWISPRSNFDVKHEARPAFDLDTARRLGSQEVGSNKQLTFNLGAPVIVPKGEFYLFARGLSGETDVVFTESPPITLTGAEDDLRIEDLKVVGVRPSPKTGGRLVTVQFKVLEDTSDEGDGEEDRERPVNDLIIGGEKGNFHIFEDQAQEVSGEVQLAGDSELENKLGVALVLDTSFSMERAKALGEMKRAAKRFVNRLENTRRPYEFRYYRFANEVDSLRNLDQISSSKASGQFTALYQAVIEALEDGQDQLEQKNSEFLSDYLVVLSDGKDTWSQNEGVDREEVVSKLEAASNVTVHTIGFGKAEEFDGDADLKEITLNGIYRRAPDIKDLDSTFEKVADSIAGVYVLTYLSNYERGSHTLEIVVERDGKTGSEEIDYGP